LTDALREALRAIEMPPADARAWLLRVRAFCERHGGEPRYAELIALLEKSVATLDEEKR
jgi:hypothetical protein